MHALSARPLSRRIASYHEDWRGRRRRRAGELVACGPAADPSGRPDGRFLLAWVVRLCDVACACFVPPCDRLDVGEWGRIEHLDDMR